MKEFMEWIENAINPKRKQAGLDIITAEEQIKCYDIIMEFQKKIAYENNVHIARIRAEDAEEARKEAAERAVAS